MGLISKIMDKYHLWKNRKLYHEILNDINDIKNKKRKELYIEIKREIRDKIYNDILKEIQENKERKNLYYEISEEIQKVKFYNEQKEELLSEFKINFVKQKFYSDCKDEFFKNIDKDLENRILNDPKFNEILSDVYFSNKHAIVVIDENLSHISYNPLKNKFKVNNERIIYTHKGVRKLGLIIKPDKLIKDLIKKENYEGIVGVFSEDDMVVYYFDQHNMCRGKEIVGYSIRSLPLLKSKNSAVAVASTLGKSYECLEDYLYSKN